MNNYLPAAAGVSTTAAVTTKKGYNMTLLDSKIPAHWAHKMHLHFPTIVTSLICSIPIHLFHTSSS